MSEKELIKIDFKYHYPEGWDDEEEEYCYESGGYGSIVIDPENPSIWCIIEGSEYNHIDSYHIKKMIQFLGPGPYEIHELESPDMEELFSNMYSKDVHTKDCQITIWTDWIKAEDIKPEEIISTSLPDDLKIPGVSDFTVLRKLMK